jgi:E3 ubiquitin-protein ligase SHPRH
MPFTPVEEQHYQSLFQQMCEDCGFDIKGSPVSEDWDPEDPGHIEKMRSWLVRLRQTALHPEVGGRNRRALGRKQGPLRTVDDVLAAMLEQSEISIRSDQRALLLSKLKRGQAFENGPEVKHALEIWTEVLEEATEIVSECRQQLHDEVIAHGVDGEAGASGSETGDSSENDTQKSKDANR